MDDIGADRTAALLEADRRSLIHPLHHPKDHERPRLALSGEGPFLRMADGHEVIDSLSGAWNVHIGHGRRELGEAAAEQIGKVAFASAYAGSSNEPAIRLAERILGLAYPNMGGVYFTTGGAESNESAFKFARYYWQRRGRKDKTRIIARQFAYHGTTMAAMCATGLPGYHRMFGPATLEVFRAPAPYPYRWTGNGDPGTGAADAVEAIIEREGADRIAAIIAEPVIGSGGVIVPPPTYFPRLREICDRHEILLIADEVITGFGRTGKWFALEHWGVLPDIVSFAKGVTSGYLPLGGVMVSKAIRATLDEAPAEEKFMHAATYSGHPVCCAVGLRNVDIIEGEGMVERAAVMGRRLIAGLEGLRDLPVVGDVRGIGLIAAVELVEDQATRKSARGLGARVAAEAYARGLMLRNRPGSTDPGSGDTLCLAPPLPTPEAVLDRIVETIRASILAAAG
jgi:adenosylmethionine-8-amino-7-oxononanoate aminotransferase